jgi:hypothetical protein
MTDIKDLAPKYNWSCFGVSFNVAPRGMLITPPEKIYTYRSHYDLDIGSLCVVAVSGEFKIVQIVAFGNHSGMDEEELKWIVSPVYAEDWLAREEEQEAIKKELAELKKIAARRMKERAVAKALEGDPEILAAYATLLHRQRSL